MEMTTPFEDLTKNLSDIIQEYDKNTEFVCINDRSKTGSSYYDPEDFNDMYLDYIYSKISNNDLFTDNTNQMQCRKIMNAIYLDGDWYFSSKVKESEYSQICLSLAVQYKEKWEEELNMQCISFVFLPETHKDRKGGFHVLIFTEDNVSVSSREEIYEKIKDSFDEYLNKTYPSTLEVKSTGFKPYTKQDYEALLDKGPLRSAQTLLPFAQKDRKSRRYVLDLKASTRCIRKQNMNFFLKGTTYLNNTTNSVQDSPDLELREISYDTDINDVELDEEEDKALRAKYISAIQNVHGEDLNIFGRKYGKLFAEFIQTLIYLSPQHRFWSMLSDHDDRLRYVFKPFIQIVVLAYFVENNGEIPSEEDIVLGTAHLFHPLLMTTVKDIKDEKFKRCSFQYVYEQVKIAYENFAHIQDHFGPEESAAYNGKEPKTETDDENDFDEDFEEEGSSVLINRNILALAEDKKVLNTKKQKDIKALEKALKQVKGDLNTKIKNLEKNKYDGAEKLDKETEKNARIQEEKKRLQEEYQDADDAENIISIQLKKFENEEDRKLKEWIYNKTEEEVSKLRQSIIAEEEEFEEKKSKIEDEISKKRIAKNEEIQKLKKQLKDIHDNEKSEKNKRIRHAYDNLQEQMLKCINDWISFVKDAIMEGMTDEIKPFRAHNKADPFAYVEPPATNREDIRHSDIRAMNPRNPSSISFYAQVIRTWIRNFLFVTFYDSRTSTDAICLTMSALLKDFIYLNNDGDNSELFIYNYQQTEELVNYPYNQWILDKPESGKSTKISGKRTKNWIKDIYTRYVKPEFESRTIKFQLMRFMEFVQHCIKIVGKDAFTDKSLTPFQSFEKGISDTFDNIISFSSVNYVRKPIEIKLENENTTFGRNGRIYFDENGDIHYSLKDNHDCFSRGCSNIIFDENYDIENNQHYKDAEKIFKTTFPIDGLRIFMERIVAATFVGGEHDLFIIMIGSGAEGKSVICNLIAAMLGCDGLANNSLMENVNGRPVKIINPTGLAEGIKSAFLLTSNNGGHDEDGLFYARDKRFLILQEPEKKNFQCLIHTDKIKEMTSGTVTTARGIFGRKQGFVIDTTPILQTNVPPSFDTGDEAIRRRVIVMPMLAKFYTDINKQRSKLKYATKADRKINSRIKKDPYLIQGLFYYLLPRIKEVIKEGWVPTSNIPKPELIVEETARIFNQSTGLVGWLSTRLRESMNGCLPLSDIVKRVEKANENEIKDKHDSLLPRERSKWEGEIILQLFAQYTAKIYRLQDQYYEQTSSNNFVVKDGIAEAIKKLSEEDGELVKEKFMDSYPASGSEISKRKRGGKVHFDDMYLFGYTFEDDNEEDDPDVDYYD